MLSPSRGASAALALGAGAVLGALARPTTTGWSTWLIGAFVMNSALVALLQQTLP